MIVVADTSPLNYLILIAQINILPRLSHRIAGLDPGESEAISLADEIGADWILLDDAAGRDAATKLGLRVTGTLGILRRAHLAGLLDLTVEVVRLRSSGFYVAEPLLQAMLESIKE